jgi:hypothetical protein
MSIVFQAGFTPSLSSLRTVSKELNALCRALKWIDEVVVSKRFHLFKLSFPNLTFVQNLWLAKMSIDPADITFGTNHIGLYDVYLKHAEFATSPIALTIDGRCRHFNTLTPYKKLRYDGTTAREPSFNERSDWVRALQKIELINIDFNYVDYNNYFEDLTGDGEICGLFMHASSLKTLKIVGGLSVDSVNLDELSPSLTSLSLVQKRHTCPLPVNWNMPNLKELCVSSGMFCSFELRHLINLETVTINHVAKVDVSYFSSRQLKSLNLDYVDEIEHLSAMKPEQFPALQHLSLVYSLGSFQDIQDPEFFQAMRRLPRLKTLDYALEYALRYTLEYAQARNGDNVLRKVHRFL